MSKKAPRLALASTAMTLLQLLALLIGAVLLIGVPAMMIWAAVDHYRQPASRRRGGSSAPGIGAALQELDRVTRPSIEHVVEAQTPLVREVEQAGD